MERVNRRTFLGVAGALGGAALAKDLFAEPKVREAKAPLSPPHDERWIPSTCHMCGGLSGILCKVADGKLVKIEPNPHNPSNFSNLSDDFWKNRGEGSCLCPKGNAGIATLYDPDRLKKPLRRTNPEKGIGVDPRWQEITWEEALEEIAARLKALRDQGEAHKLLWFTEDSSFIPLQADFLKLFGTPNFMQHSNLCDVSRKASFKMVMGDERPLMDAIQSKYILLFGWNPLSATKWSHLPRILMRALERGARLVVVDPVLSYTASKAHEWVPIRPGTDGALALAMGHVIVKEKLYDEDFIRNWTVGFEQYAEHVEDKTPEWAEEITTVSAETIARIAREFATTKPAVVDVWSGGHHTNGVQGGRAIALLAALVGGYDRPGTLLIPERSGPKFPDVQPPRKITQPRFDGLETYPFGHGSGVYCELFQRLAEGKGPYQPKVAVIIFQNPLMAVPGTETVAAGLRNLAFVVVNDIFLSETAQFADIVLPGTTYLERYDLNVPWVTWSAVALRQPVVEPLFGQLPEYDFVIELGRRLGLKDASGHEYFRDLRYDHYLSQALQAGGPQLSLEEFRKLPGAVWVSPKGTRYEKYKEEIPREKIAAAVIEGNAVYDRPKDQGGKRIGTLINSRPVRGFFTLSGKIEFYAESFKTKRDAAGNPVDPLPVYTPRAWQPDAQYPLYLINWKEATHTHTRTHNNVYLMDLKRTNPLLINVRTAERLGIKDGEEVWVESSYGKVKARVRVTQGIHPEVVGLQHGFGHWAMGRVAKGKGFSDSVLRPTKADPLSGQALNKECCVRLYKA